MWCVCGVCVWCVWCVCVYVCVCVCVRVYVCVAYVWCAWHVLRLELVVSKTKTTSRDNSCRQYIMRVHTQGYGTQEISLYAGLPRRQLLTVLISSFTQQSNKKPCEHLYGGRRQISYKTAYLWWCATPFTLHTTRTSF